MASPITYLKHVRDEFAHITWPSARTALAHTLVVIVIGAALSLFVGVLDGVLGFVVSRLAGA